MGNRKIAAEEASALVHACRELVRRRRSKSFYSPDAEDIEQEACVRALDAIEPGKVHDPFRYLMRIVRNLFVDHHRRERRGSLIVRSLYAVDANKADSINPERIVAGRQDLQRAIDAIEMLPPRCHEAFVLHRFHNLSYPAIARRMGVSTGTVEKHIAEAMVRIARAVRMTEDSR